MLTDAGDSSAAVIIGTKAGDAQPGLSKRLKSLLRKLRTLAADVGATAPHEDISPLANQLAALDNACTALDKRLHSLGATPHPHKHPK